MLRRRALLSMPLVAAAGVVHAQTADWAKVAEAANKQGHLNVMHNIPPPGGDTWFETFRKAYPGITVEATRLGSSALAQRFTTEYAAGASQTDAVMTLFDDTLVRWQQDGWVRRVSVPEAAGMPAHYKRDDRLFTIQLTRSVAFSNKSRVRENDAPRDWADFFDPKWKDKVGMDPPWRSVVVQGMIAEWDAIGLKDTARRLKANGVRFFNGSAGVIQALIRGDINVAPVIESPVASALADGAPLRVNFPTSGVPAMESMAFLPEKAPHPEVGLVFLNWVLSKEGQQALQDITGATVTRPGVTPSKILPGVEGQKIVLATDVLTPERQKAIIEEWRSVFGLQ
jgi:iron(III) transport system substrate-binding protein